MDEDIDSLLGAAFGDVDYGSLLSSIGQGAGNVIQSIQGKKPDSRPAPAPPASAAASSAGSFIDKAKPYLPYVLVGGGVLLALRVLKKRRK